MSKTSNVELQAALEEWNTALGAIFGDLDGPDRYDAVLKFVESAMPGKMARDFENMASFFNDAPESDPNSNLNIFKRSIGFAVTGENIAKVDEERAGFVNFVFTEKAGEAENIEFCLEASGKWVMNK